ncbi:hypothetical protein [Streptococcus marmotae]|uniref:hypothetical protein n=1 Tax=Streptococcus marmotae TaxID=1825069 RepID=UPI000831647E|nr:hypothetical protein [Streptococcus marmotae]
MFLVNMVIGGVFFNSDVSALVFLVWATWGFFYNKLYIKELFAKGYKPATDFDAEVIRTKVNL